MFWEISKTMPIESGNMRRGQTTPCAPIQPKRRRRDSKKSGNPLTFGLGFLNSLFEIWPEGLIFCLVVAAVIFQKGLDINDKNIILRLSSLPVVTKIRKLRCKTMNFLAA